MHHKRIALLVVMLAGCLFPTQMFALDTPTPTFVQAMVGAAQFSEDDLTFSEISTTDGTVTSDNDLSTMPYLGMAFQYPFHGENTQVGLDGSFLFGWRSKDTTVRGGSGQIAISVDSSLWLADLVSAFSSNIPSLIAGEPMLRQGRLLCLVNTLKIQTKRIRLTKSTRKTTIVIPSLVLVHMLA